jgi:hypothetical protein
VKAARWLGIADVPLYSVGPAITTQAGPEPWRQALRILSCRSARPEEDRQTIKEMTPDQFSALCAGAGLVEDLWARRAPSGQNHFRCRPTWPASRAPFGMEAGRLTLRHAQAKQVPVGPIVGLIGLVAIIAARSGS